jgi:hypothetical protein
MQGCGCVVEQVGSAEPVTQSLVPAPLPLVARKFWALTVPPALTLPVVFTPGGAEPSNVVIVSNIAPPQGTGPTFPFTPDGAVRQTMHVDAPLTVEVKMILKVVVVFKVEHPLTAVLAELGPVIPFAASAATYSY